MRKHHSKPPPPFKFPTTCVELAAEVIRPSRRRGWVCRARADRSRHRTASPLSRVSVFRHIPGERPSYFIRTHTQSWIVHAVIACDLCGPLVVECETESTTAPKLGSCCSALNHPLPICPCVPLSCPLVLFHDCSLYFYFVLFRPCNFSQ